MNNYDEIKKLLKSSRNLLEKNNNVTNIRETYLKRGLMVEQDTNVSSTTNLGQPRPNVAMDTEKEIYQETKPKDDKQQAYRISGGILVMHGKNKTDLEITTEDKRSFQETMDEFVDEVSEMVDFYPLNVYTTSVEWSGKVIDQDLEFLYSIGENNGVYINGTLSRVDDEFLDFVSKLRSYFQKFKTKWAKVLASRKKTQIGTDKEYIETDTSKIFDYTNIELTNNKKYVAYLKNQTEINSIDKGTSTLSTQLRKIFNLGLYAKGFPVDFTGNIKEWKALSETEKLKKSPIHKKCEALYKKLERWTLVEKAELLENMGLIESYDSETKQYTINPENNDISKFITYIKNELVKQDYSEEELAILNNKIGSTIDISISPFAPRIEKALAALMNNRLVKLKSKGAALVEGSPTFMQKWKKPTEEDIKNYKNDDLPSYVVDIDGKQNTKGCGVKIAITTNYENLFRTAFFTKNDKNEYVKSKETIGVYDVKIDPETKKPKKVLNNEKSFARLNEMIQVEAWKNDSENRKKIQIAGVRIPTQGPNSIEFAEIFEFLPASAGNIIIIPSEIVAKSGTDFDVDKLTSYIKYITKQGALLKDTYNSKKDIDVVIKDLEAIHPKVIMINLEIEIPWEYG